MDRRDFLISAAVSSFLYHESCGRTKSQSNKTADALPAFDKTLEEKNALTLLGAVTLGFNAKQVDLLIGKMPLDALSLLYKDEDLMLPLNYEFAEDRTVALGETWINAPYRLDVFYEQYRKKSLRTWLLDNYHTHGASLRMKLLLFWLNHFGVSDVFEHKYEYIHIKFLHDNAWGNCKDIVKKITIDPAMLRFLSGFENTVHAPNENFARELLELFTIGKGPLAADGDYTTYTEKDVEQCAKILTGWTDKGWFTQDSNEKVSVVFREQNHDQTTKQLSHRFSNRKIKPNGSKEFEDLIDIIFEQEQTAIFLTQKIYRWFVADHIDENTLKNIIMPLAATLRNNNYELKPMLEKLLTSAHFYETSTHSVRIKSPAEFVFGVLNFLPMKLPKPLKAYHNFWFRVFQLMNNMGMEMLKPPSVAGWKAYYQEPDFSKLWINAATLQGRMAFAEFITSDNLTIEGEQVDVDIEALLKTANCNSANELTRFCCKHLFKSPPTDDLLTQATAACSAATGGIDARGVKQMLRILLTAPQIHLA
ncbi:MAG: DUF1800 family protein [Chitinophagales bacterium]|nr:DUF1800 family protein [Chitinophagales bacterium]